MPSDLEAQVRAAAPCHHCNGTGEHEFSDDDGCVQIGVCTLCCGSGAILTAAAVARALEAALPRERYHIPHEQEQADAVRAVLMNAALAALREGP